MLPPFAATPLTVSNSRAVSNCQSAFPSAVEYANIVPVLEPKKTTPGITVIGAAPPSGGDARQVIAPLARFNAVRPSGSLARVIGKYARRSSDAAPHMS